MPKRYKSYTEKNCIVSDVVNGSYTFEFPYFFITSTNKKHIIVRQCKCLYEHVDEKGNANSYMVGDIQMHADFITDEPDIDHFCIYVNEMRTKYNKYEYLGSKLQFKVWFTNMDGVPANPKHFHLELTYFY